MTHLPLELALPPCPHQRALLPPDLCALDGRLLLHGTDPRVFEAHGVHVRCPLPCDLGLLWGVTIGVIESGFEAHSVHVRCPLPCDLGLGLLRCWIGRVMEFMHPGIIRCASHITHHTAHAESPRATSLVSLHPAAQIT